MKSIKNESVAITVGVLVGYSYDVDYNLISSIPGIKYEFPWVLCGSGGQLRRHIMELERKRVHE